MVVVTVRVNWKTLYVLHVELALEAPETAFVAGLSRCMAISWPVETSEKLQEVASLGMNAIVYYWTTSIWVARRRARCPWSFGIWRHFVVYSMMRKKIPPR